jgi:hypothetical protein
LLWCCWSLAGEGQVPLPEVEPAFVLPAHAVAVFAFHAASHADGAFCERCLREVVAGYAGAGDLDAVYVLVDAADGKTHSAAARLGGAPTAFLRTTRAHA